MTKAFEFQRWLRENGPKTLKEIRDAGWTNFAGKTRTNMLAWGAIETYTGPNPHSEAKHARIVTTLYMAGNKDYKPQWGRPKGFKTSLAVDAAKIQKWIGALEARGFLVTMRDPS